MTDQLVNSGASEAQAPDLGSGLNITPGHGLLISLLDLRQQGQRIMRRKEIQGESRMQGGKSAEDGRMPNRMRDHSRVERGDVGVMLVASAASASGFFLAADLV